MSQHLLQRGAVRIAYERRGDGPLILLVQGLGLSGRMWLGLPGGLLKNGRCVVTPDNRGMGRSDAPRPPYRMAELADDLAAVIAEVDRGPAIVVGISLGGMIAQHLALRHPALVRGLVLAATTCGLPHGRMIRPGFLPLMIRSSLGDERATRAIHAFLVDERSLQRNQKIFDKWEEVLCSEPVRWAGILGQLAAGATHSTGFSLWRLRCPVEVITGAHDRIVPPENSRILARRIPDAALTVVPQAGHAFPLEAPESLPLAVRRLEARLAG